MPRDLSSYLFMAEKDCVENLIAVYDHNESQSAQISQKAAHLIGQVRAMPRKSGSIEGFFQAYGLDTEEGIALMCLAEALLRIPDSKTADKLIRDKIARTKWMQSKAVQDDWLMCMAGLGLSVSRGTLESPFSKLGEPVIRKALAEGMKILGGQFVLGQTIGDALKNAAATGKDKNILFSFDMLGEGARTMEDAKTYFAAYDAAIEAIGTARHTASAAPGISVKLSALYPRYSAAQEAHCLPALTSSLLALCKKAAKYNICLTVDAEESERLETSLKIIRTLFSDITLQNWEGFGLAVQAYGKRALPLVENLIDMARAQGRKLQVRLVKGAYWDSEIKRAQIRGLADYPVFTRKVHTDLSYLVCAQKMLQARDCLYPMFGTHNAHTIQAILAMADGDSTGFEFQRLHGMGGSLYDIVLKEEKVPVRIYAPVGKHGDLLPYLVRRLLENGANSSFVNKVFDDGIAPENLVADPVQKILLQKPLPHPDIPLPAALFPDRQNSHGYDLDDAATRQSLMTSMEAAYDRREIVAASIVGGRQEKTGNLMEIINPAASDEPVGTSDAANADLVDRAFTAAAAAFPAWNNTPAGRRAAILNKIADLYEEEASLLLSLCVHEAGKTLADAVAELREAVDFCRYYAALGEVQFDQNGVNLRSYTGESNNIMLQGRGTFVCISPWNFPLAIFTGQIVAALMAGNAVIAKPAEQTPFVAQAAVALMHKAGIPKDALHLLIGDGRVGEMIVQHKNVAGVAFTGSTGAAQSINRALAAKDGPIVPLIAETGGLNAMIVDSSALTEQVIDDVILSAFGSAGQRCSAARVLFVQEDVADKTIKMLQGAMACLKIGDPRFYETDIGPLIDEEALTALQKHKSYLEGTSRFLAEAPLSFEMRQRGHYFAPIAYEISDLADLKGEVFGPALHVIRYSGDLLGKAIDMINNSGYGLTFGIHTRIDSTALAVARAVNAGNIYINRSIIGAVVGVQPFGGNGLSGTGPKAGGPHYLHRFACEKAISINTTATGGNASLVMLDE